MSNREIIARIKKNPERWKIVDGKIYFHCWCDEWHSIKFIGKPHRRHVDIDKVVERVHRREMKKKI